MSFSWDLNALAPGLAWREAGTARDIVLVHGLGMSSAYFARLARVLHERGHAPIAPDLPGFGHSPADRVATPASHLAALTGWADSLGIRNAAWVGHSISCSLVVELAQARPDLVARGVLIGPLWSTRRWLDARSLFALASDVFLESSEPRRFAVGGIRHSGVLRWWRTWCGYRPLLRHPPSIASGWLIVRGERDPFRHHDEACGVVVAGAHACHVTHPVETARAILG